MTESSCLILSCDGGGIRGLVPALLLQQLDQELGFLSRVDLFAGTSTGGVIALGLANDVAISDIVDIYLTKGAEIFQPYSIWSSARLKKPIPTKVKNLHPRASALSGDLLHVKYTNAGVKKLIGQTYPATKKLSEMKRKVLVTTLNLYQTQRNAWMPTVLTNLAGSETADFTVLDAALATSAAPVYFPPHIFEKDEVKWAFADGGIFANNPGTLATASAIAARDPKPKGVAAQNIKLLSLGTGFTLDGIPSRNLLPQFWYGVLAWLSPITRSPTPQFPLISALMDSVADVDSFQCANLLGDNYRRGNVQLTEQIDLDDYKKVDALKKMTDDYMASAEWVEIKKWVGNQFV